MLKLIPITDIPDRAVYDMLQEIGQNENGFHNKACGMSYEEYELWLKHEYAFDCGMLEDWMVPQTSYWLYDDNLPVGYGRLRHTLNDALRQHSGHIGYAIASSHRGKGYGNAILSLLLEEAQKLGLSEVQVGANCDNLPSNRIILHNGGILVRIEECKKFYKILL
ncbi:MAG: GNAT family N-acetyltransferase [Clostridia bacterium]|nr:GNAT family N-acetyltransferase [Clostridia bacterium]